MCTKSKPSHACVEVDEGLLARLALVAFELGARELPLAVIVAALLDQAACRLEAERDHRVPIDP